MAVLIAAAGVSAAGVPVAEQLLPDLRPLQPADLQVGREGQGTVLEFATDVLNRGAGPLELKPVDDPADCDGNGDPTDDLGAEQQVFEDTDPDDVFIRGEDTAQPVWAGCQHFHAAHDHWHFDDFGVYKLFKISKKDGLRLKVVARSDKVTFCMVDTFERLGELPGSPDQNYYPRKPNGDRALTCGEDTTTGISIGYVDNYASHLVGQELPITELREGAYCLRVRTDPLNKLQESNESNNRHSVRVRLKETATPAGLKLVTPKNEWCPR